MAKTTAQIRNASTLATYFSHQRYAFWHGLHQLTKKPFSSILTIAVLSITLLLPTVLFVLLNNAQQNTTLWQNTTGISVYLQTGLNREQIQQTQTTLKNINSVAQVRYISPDEGLQEFASKTGLNDVLNSLNTNPIPPLFTVKPTDESPASINLLVSQLRSLPNVTAVKIDMQWVERLNAIIGLLKQFTYGLSFLLGLAVLLIIGNTIRMSLQSYQQEIDVIKLIGGNDAFIRRPFIYSAILCGGTSGIAAIIAINIFLWWLQNPLDHLAQTYHAQVDLHALNIEQIFLVLMISIGLSVFASWLVVMRYLNDRG